jgi:hypothetical protein
MTARSVVSAIVERLQPNRNVRFFCRYRGNTGRRADIAKATQMTQLRHQADRVQGWWGAICLSLARRKVLGFNYRLRRIFRGACMRRREFISLLGGAVSPPAGAAAPELS